MSVKIHVGDCREVLRRMAAQSVQCVTTSPPYWGLRDYSTEPVSWGGSDDCDHVWGKSKIVTQTAHTGLKKAAEMSDGRLRQHNRGDDGGYAMSASTGQFCRRCGCWRGNLGLEPTPHLFVEHMVEVFREVWRVLRDDGTLWLDLGDSYAANRPRGQPAPTNTGNRTGYLSSNTQGIMSVPHGLKPKDLIGIPWRVALALQADGWYLRSAMPWIKKSAMPESVRDRPTTAHEYVFLLTKSKRYFYDSESVKVGALQPIGEPKTTSQHKQAEMGRTVSTLGTNQGAPSRNRRTSDSFNESLDIRIEDQHAYLVHLKHIRDNGGMLLSENGDPVALLVNTHGYAGAHFATFPPKLIEPMIKSGSSGRGCCRDCRAGWVRVIEKSGAIKNADYETEKRSAMQQGGKASTTLNGTPAATKTLGWQPSCSCYDALYRSDFPQSRNARKRYQRQVSGDWWRRVRRRPGLANWSAEPCTILDPFVGSGTTLLVADRLGRDAIGIDLSGDYAEMARWRVEGDAPMFVDVEVIR